MTNGIISKDNIYQENETPDSNAWLLIKFLDSSTKTPGYVSVASLMKLTIRAKADNIDNYYNFLYDKKFVVTISWF